MDVNNLMRCKSCQADLPDGATVCPKCGCSVDPTDRFVDETIALFKTMKNPGTAEQKSANAVGSEGSSTLGLENLVEEEAQNVSVPHRKPANKRVIYSVAITLGVMVLSVLAFVVYNFMFAPKVSLTGISASTYSAAQKVLMKASDEQYLNTLKDTLKTSEDDFDTEVQAFYTELQTFINKIDTTSTNEQAYASMAANLSYERVLCVYYESILDQYEEDQKAYVTDYIKQVESLLDQMITIKSDSDFTAAMTAYNTFAQSLQTSAS